MEFDAAEPEEPPRDAETLLTPLTPDVTASPRAALTRKLTDVIVLPAGRLSQNERSLVGDLLLQIVDKIEPTLRRETVTRLARAPETPPALLRALLLNEPETGALLAREADYLPETLLVETALDGDTAQREAIASRPDLSAVVADACLRYEELEVCRAVLRRESCVLSPAAVNKLVALSATKPELQTPLLRRRELEPAHGFMMFWWVSRELRKRIIARFALDRSIVQDTLQDLYPKVFRDPRPDPLVRDILVLAERRHRPRGANGEPVARDVVIKTLAAARRHPSEEIVQAISMIAGVSRELASRILRDPSGEPFAVMAKSLSTPRDDFYAIIADGGSPHADEGEILAEAEYLLGVFDGMARDYARAVLRYWDWNANPRIAQISQLLGLLDDEFD